MSPEPQKSSIGSRPRFEPYYIHALLAFIALLTSDLLIVANRGLMMPTGAAPVRKSQAPLRKEKPAYDQIIARNMFNADGVIPPPINKEHAPQEENVPVLSQLPLVLIGTIVHVNQAKSIATIELKNLNKILPFAPNDDMEGLGKMLRVDRKRAIFRNSANNRVEYIEIKDDNAISFETSKKGSLEIEQRGNNFVVKKSELDKWLNNLPEILQQARAVPHQDATGKVDGFIILDIQPGSLFEKLGLLKNDLLKSVNGQKVDSPARALELYQDLKTANSVAIEVDRAGRSETLSYNVQ